MEKGCKLCKHPESLHDVICLRSLLLIHDLQPDLSLPVPATVVVARTRSLPLKDPSRTGSFRLPALNWHATLQFSIIADGSIQREAAPLKITVRGTG